MVSSRASRTPSLFRSPHFRSPGKRSKRAASSASSDPQVPRRLYPQKDPMGSPIRRILVCPKNHGPGKMSSSLTPSLSTLFWLVAQLTVVAQLKLPVLTLTELTDNSSPLFSTEP